MFNKDRFDVDLGTGAVICPAGVSAPIRPAAAGGGTASFAQACAQCPLRAQCTTAVGVRTISIGPSEQTLTDARARQADPAWIADYPGTAPRSSARSATSCATATADAAPESAAPPASTPTSGC